MAAGRRAEGVDDWGGVTESPEEDAWDLTWRILFPGMVRRPRGSWGQVLECRPVDWAVVCRVASVDDACQHGVQIQGASRVEAASRQLSQLAALGVGTSSLGASTWKLLRLPRQQGDGRWQLVAHGMSKLSPGVHLSAERTQTGARSRRILCRVRIFRPRQAELRPQGFQRSILFLNVKHRTSVPRRCLEVTSCHSFWATVGLLVATSR